MNNNFLNVDFDNIDTYQVNQNDYQVFLKDIQGLFNCIYQQIDKINYTNINIIKIIKIGVYEFINNLENYKLQNIYLEVDPYTPTKRIKKVPYLIITNLKLKSYVLKAYSLNSTIYLRYDKDKELIRSSITFNIIEKQQEKSLLLTFYLNNNEGLSIVRVEEAIYDGFSKGYCTTIY